MSTLETRTETIPRTYPRWLSALDLAGLETLDTLPDLTALQVLDLPDSDGEPMENHRERLQIHLGFESLHQHWSGRDDFFTGGNMFVYYSLEQVRRVIEELDDPRRPKHAFRGPDLFVVLDVDGSRYRSKWVVWEEDGRYPDVIFEFLSPSTRKKDLVEKKKLYEQTFGTREYFCFDYIHPEGEQSLMGWRLDARGQYRAIRPNERGWLWSEVLGLWVGKWRGVLWRDDTTWMRFYTPEEELVLTESEAERQRAEAAEAELARLRALLAQRETEIQGVGRTRYTEVRDEHD